jgi:hypothetical protein
LDEKDKYRERSLFTVDVPDDEVKLGKGMKAVINKLPEGSSIMCSRKTKEYPPYNFSLLALGKHKAKGISSIIINLFFFC